MRSFFSIPRCSLCVDHYGELADICFGDIHVGVYKEDEIGINSLVVRNVFWNEHLQNAKDKGYLTLNPISGSIVNSSQKYMYQQKKGPGVSASFFLRKIYGKKMPVYDITLPPVKMVYILKASVNLVMREIGSHSRYWFLIDCFNWFAKCIKKNNAT